jgi:hypothetical protein
VPAEAGNGAYRVRIAATMNRRRAEAVALQLRRCLQQLGFAGATITVTPSRRRSPPPGEANTEPGGSSA